MIPTNPTSDEDLARQAQEGVRRALDELIDRYSIRLVRFLVLNCKVPISEVEDLAQDVWLKVYSALPARRPGPFRGWLFSIAHNTSLDLFKSARFRKMHTNEELSEETYAKAGDEETLDQHEERVILRKCLSKLPSEFRAVLQGQLRGEDQQQISEKLGIAVGTVKSRLSRAKDELRKCVEKQR